MADPVKTYKEGGHLVSGHADTCRTSFRQHCITHPGQTNISIGRPVHTDPRHLARVRMDGMHFDRTTQAKT